MKRYMAGMQLRFIIAVLLAGASAGWGAEQAPAAGGETQASADLGRAVLESFAAARENEGAVGAVARFRMDYQGREEEVLCLVASDDPAMRRAAVWAYGKLAEQREGKEDVPARLAAALLDGDAAVALEAVTVISEIGGDGGLRALEALLPENVRSAESKGKDAAVTEENAGDRIVIACASAAAKLGNTGASRVLLRYLSHPEEHLRLLAAEALVVRGNVAGLPVLIDLLDSTDAGVREHALITLALRVGSELPTPPGAAGTGKKYRRTAALWHRWWRRHRRMVTIVPETP